MERMEARGVDVGGRHHMIDHTNVAGLRLLVRHEGGRVKCANAGSLEVRHAGCKPGTRGGARAGKVRCGRTQHCRLLQESGVN